MGGGWGWVGFVGGLRFGGLVGAVDECCEVGEGGLEGLGLGFEFFGDAGGLFGGGGIGLGDLVHLGDGGIDLLDALALFEGGGGDFGGELVDEADFFDDSVEALGDVGADFGALPGFVDGGLDLAGGFAGGLGAALGEVTDFIGDHGEACSGFTGAGCFDGGVEGEEVGLEGDFVDGLDNFGDIAAGGLDGLHGVLHGLHILDCGIAGGIGLGSEVFDLAGVFGVALGHAGHLFEGGTGFLEGGGLGAGTFGDGLAGAAELEGHAGGLFGTLFELGDGFCEATADTEREAEGDDGGDDGIGAEESGLEGFELGDFTGGELFSGGDGLIGEFKEVFAGREEGWVGGWVLAGGLDILFEAGPGGLELVEAGDEFGVGGFGELEFGAAVEESGEDAVDLRDEFIGGLGGEFEFDEALGGAADDAAEIDDAAVGAHAIEVEGGCGEVESCDQEEQGGDAPQFGFDG
ncbi:MAG: hypothetical protein RI897_4063 [Verrucomicrobiota bacterium]